MAIAAEHYWPRLDWVERSVARLTLVHRKSVCSRTLVAYRATASRLRAAEPSQLREPGRTPCALLHDRGRSRRRASDGKSPVALSSRL